MNRLRSVFKRLMFLVWAIFSLWVTITTTQLYQHAKQPVDAILVLGGSIQRESHVAEQVAKYAEGEVQLQTQPLSSPEWHQIPILFSQGSKPPCIRLLFEQVAATLDNAWLEGCAKSTFDNYRYSVPILNLWNIKHVKVVTSPSHVPRAQWLAQIILGSHGIWVEMELVNETGVPGNVERPIKTALDVTRSLLWAFVSHVYSPTCNQLIPLASVDLDQWDRQGFKCERQAKISQ